MGGRGRAGPRGLRAGGQARGHLGPLAAGRAARGCSRPGVGSELLRRAHDYAHDAMGRIILASPDPRAIRAYSRLGLDLHPCFIAKGTPRGVRAPAGLRDGHRRRPPVHRGGRPLRPRRRAPVEHRDAARDGPDAARPARARLRRSSATTRCARWRALDDESAADGAARRAGAGARATIRSATSRRRSSGRCRCCSRPGSTSAAPTARSSWRATSAGSGPTCRAAPSCECGHKFP